MATKVPQILPDWSALGEWCRYEDGTSAVEFVPCTSIDVNTGGINTIGGVPDKNLFIDALEKLYQDKEYRTQLGEKGYKLITDGKYDWKNIAAIFDQEFKQLLRLGKLNANTIS